MDKTDYNEEPAKPGTPLEPDELEEDVPEKRTYYQDKESLGGPERGRKAPEPAAHPTTELAVGKRSAKPGKPSSGSHPTSELDVRRRR